MDAAVGFVTSARPIKPRVGSASVFPHGDCKIPLLHEGSAVTKGTKHLELQLMHNDAPLILCRFFLAGILGLECWQLFSADSYCSSACGQRLNGGRIQRGSSQKRHSIAPHCQSQGTCCEPMWSMPALMLDQDHGDQRNRRARLCTKDNSI